MKPLQTAGGIQTLTIINEVATAYLFGRCRTEKGVQMNRRLQLNILPGANEYSVCTAPESIDSTPNELDYIIKLLTQLKEERVTRDRAEKRCKELEERIAGGALLSQLLDHTDN